MSKAKRATRAHGVPKETYRNADSKAVGSGATRAEFLSRHEWLNLLLRNMTDYAIFAVDPNGCVMSWNAGAEKIKGYRSGEIIGQHISRFYPREDVESGKPERELRAAAEQGHFEGEGWRVRKDGSRFWANVVTTALRDEAGQLRGFAKVMRDLTTHKWSEEEKFSRIFRSSPAGMFISTMEEGRQLEINESTEELIGYSREEVVGRTAKELGIWADLEDRARMVQQLREGGSVRNLEINIRHRSGEMRAALLSAEMIELGGKACVLGVLRDITEQKRAEDALHVRARQQAAIAQLSRRGLAGVPLSQLMDESVALVSRTLDTEFCQVLELLPGGRTLLLRAGVGWKPGLTGQVTVPADESQAGYTLLSRGPVVVDDLAEEKRFRGPVLLRDHAIVSGVSVIIGGHEHPFGVLGAHTTRRRNFTQDDTQFLQTIADVLATAIERARAEEQVKEQQEAIRQLSTPVLRVRERLLILPIIGTLDPARADQLTAQLLERIRAERAKVVVMDLTGVAAIDSPIANRMIRTVQAARLLGATVIVSGLSREITKTVVHLGVNFDVMRIARDLQSGIEEAELLLGYRVMPSAA